MKKPSAEKNSQKGYTPVKAIAVACLCGAVAAVLVLLAGSAMFASRDVSRAAMFPFAIAAMLAAGASAGFICGRITRKSGMLYGFFCGTALFIVVSILEYILINGDTTMLALYKYAAYAVSAMIGGVAGVNKRRRAKKPKLHTK